MRVSSCAPERGGRHEASSVGLWRHHGLGCCRSGCSAVIDSRAVELPACTATDLVPRFTKIVVTQGPTSFTRAARGKEAVVRAHLTIPTTCTVARTQSITPTTATLTITGGSASGPIANYNPLSGALGSAALADSTADPLFLVPATALRPGDGSTTSALTLAVEVKYTRVSGGVTTPGLTTPAGAAGSTKTLTLDRKTNALRILRFRSATRRARPSSGTPPRIRPLRR